MVVELLAKKCNCSHVLDVGSGQGHLARLWHSTKSCVLPLWT
ncbi:hypothetical protein MRX96_023204 [Rhipicephalus microplus]